MNLKVCRALMTSVSIQHLLADSTSLLLMKAALAEYAVGLRDVVVANTYFSC